MDAENAISSAQEVVDRALSSLDAPRVLDAGCGDRLPYLSFGPNPHFVGIDISQAQLDRNDLIEEKIVGDIQRMALPQAFDVVVCWNVLEHLPRPDLALANMASSVRDGGIILLRAPRLFSLKGLITKFTPHRLHVWHYREARHDDHAGVDDHSAFPTHLKLSMSPSAVRRFAKANGLQVIYDAGFESRAQRTLRHRFGVKGALWKALTVAVASLSLGLISADVTEYCMILLKSPATVSHGP